MNGIQANPGTWPQKGRIPLVFSLYLIRALGTSVSTYLWSGRPGNRVQGSTGYTQELALILH
jgi:hypothetical protein